MLIAREDGRQLDVRVEGPAGGTPLLFHHGTPGSAVQVNAVRRAAEARGLRTVTYSRPGYGGSTPHPGRTVADAAADAAAVLDALDAPRALTAGWSGGGPHALACAALLPDRVAGVLSIAGVGPFTASDLDFLAGMGQDNHDEFGAALAGRDELHTYLEGQAEGMRQATPEQVVEGMRSLLPDVDVAVFTDEFGADLAAMFAEALRTGVDGWQDDDLAFVRPWGFDLATITVPAFLWQGSADLMVPFAHGQWLATAVPGATVHLLDGEGHLSILLGSIDAMLDELVGVL